MFAAAKRYINIISNELKSYNENIDWDSFFVSIYSKDKDDKYIFERIKSCIWINQSFESVQVNEIYFPYYFQILKPIIDKPSEKLPSVYIIDEPALANNYPSFNSKAVISPLPDEFVLRLRQKVDIIKRICSVCGINVIDSSSVKLNTLDLSHTYVFPVFSILSKQVTDELTKMYSSSFNSDTISHILYDNDCYNYKIESEVVNNIMLIIRMLQLGVNIDDVLLLWKLDYRFYFITLKEDTN